MINSTDRVKIEEVLHRAQDERSVPHAMKSRKAYWIGYVLRRNYLLKRVIEREICRRIHVTEDGKEYVSSY